MANERFCINCHSAFPADAVECPFCKTKTANQNPGGTLPSGSVLADKYTIGRVKDLDGEGVYYEAFNNDLRMPVLIKEYLPVTLCSKRDEKGAIVVREGSEVPYKTTLVDFVDFYKELMRLSGRPGIARIESLFKANNTVYVVFEAKKSLTLAEWLGKQTEPLSFSESVALLQPVLLGLSAMHELGLVHRGVCPENISITPEGKAYLTGYATLSLRSMNSDLKPMLYEGYSAPEQYSNTEFQGPYTDVYSIAAVLYTMAAGAAPKTVSGSCPSLKQLGVKVPAYVSQALDAAMQAAPRARTQDISTLRLQLEEDESTLQMRRVSGKSGKAAAGSFSKEGKFILIGVVAMVLVVSVLWMLIRSTLPQQNDPASSLPESAPVSSSEAQPTVPPAQYGQAPNFVGTKYADIQANDQYMSQYVFTTAEAFSDTYSKGVIMEQTPKAGEGMNSNTVQLVISKGPNTVTMPNVLSYSTGDVISMLKDAGITQYTFVTRMNDGTMKEGLAVETSPGAGKTVNLETDVVTVYFAGTAPTPTPEPTPVPTPEVIEVPEAPAEG